MKLFLDTSVLVPVLLGEHPHHEASKALLRTINRKTGCCAAHSLAEVYSTLTRLPPPFRQDPDRALLFVADLQARLSLITLDGDEYFQAIGDFSTMRVSGGAVYDGLLARCALKAKAEAIYTWNIRHYRLFGPEVQKRLRTP